MVALDDLEKSSRPEHGTTSRLAEPSRELVSPTPTKGAETLNSDAQQDTEMSIAHSSDAKDVHDDGKATGVTCGADPADFPEGGLRAWLVVLGASNNSLFITPQSHLSHVK